jgi:hypothetical protein
MRCAESLLMCCYACSTAAAVARDRVANVLLAYKVRIDA